MNKKIITTLLASVCLMGPASVMLTAAPQAVQAAANKKVQVRGNKKVRLYTIKGKKSNAYASANKKYTYTSKKYLKIGKKKHLAYKIGNNSHWLLAKDAKVVKTASNTAPKKSYSQTDIKLPSGYTRKALLQAYKGKPSAKFIAASMKGMEENNFSRLALSKSGNDAKIIDPDNLSASDQKELAEFSLSALNSARKQLGLKPWVYSSGVQKLADDIAKEYQDHGRSIKDSGHYVAGIVRACKKNGLNLDDNYVEDMAGFTIDKEKMPMGEMKRNIYFGLKQMIFGFTGSGEEERNNKRLYREWEHAGDLFNTQGSRYDGDFNYYGFSISHTGNIYSMHYISVPSFVVKSHEYNSSFKI